MHDQYDRWAAARDRVEDSPDAKASLPTEADDVAASNPLCQRELAILTELAAFDAGELDADDRAAADRVLSALGQHHDRRVVPLRPGTAPPTDAPGRNSARRFPRRWTPAALVAMLAAATLAFLLLPSKHAVETVSGPVTFARAPAEWRLALSGSEVQVDGEAAQAGRQLAVGAILTTGEQHACMTLERVAAVCLDANSSVRVTADLPASGERQLEVLGGTLVADVVERRDPTAFSLTSGSLEARALGTFFGLEVDDRGRKLVAVLEGRVEVSAGSISSVLSPSEQWLVAPADPGPQTLTPARALRYRELVSRPEIWRHGGTSVHIETTPRGAEVSLDGELVGVSPLSILAAPGEHQVRVALANHAPAELSVNLSAEEDNRFVPFMLEKVAAPPASEATQVRQTSKDSAADLLEKARKLMSEGQWAQAAATYRKLRSAYPGSAEAKTVLVALGHLQLDRLGQPSAAKRSFSTYLSAGGGALSQEARHGKIRALRQLGANRAEAAAIREYLAKHPSGLDVARLTARLEELNQPK